MTQQETFDTVATHLLTQNRKAEKEGFGNCYRTESGLKCAVGCLISDRDYNPRFEDTTVFTNPQLRSLLVSYGHDIVLLAFLQDVHDRSDVCDWPKELAMVAINFKLQFTLTNRR